MPYIGKSPQQGNYSKLDDFSGDFDGSDATHAIASGGTAIDPITPNALIISINGVLQEPATDYTVSGSNITFTTAPTSGDNFFGVAMGEGVSIGTPSNSSVTSAKLSGNLTVPGTLNTDDTTDSTSGTSGSLQTDGGIGAVKDIFTNATINVAGDTAAGDNAAIGYTSAEGLILTGQGSTNDVTIKNDADADVITIPTGGTATTFAGDVTMIGTTPTLTIGDAGAEDAAIVFDGNAQDFHIGLDDTADSLVLGLGSALGTTTHIKMDAAGIVTKPLQPSFSAIVSSTISNVTGDSTAYIIVYNSEEFDTNGDFNTTDGLFTAPVAGVYSFTAGVVLGGITSSHTKCDIFIGDGTDNWFGAAENLYAVSWSGNRYLDLAAIFWMDAGVTAHVELRIYNGAKVIDVTGASYPVNWFSGCLLA